VKQKAIVCIVLILVTILAGCEREVPAYVAADNSSTAQVDIWGDTSKDAGVYMNYENGRMVTVISWYSAPDSVENINDVSVSVNGLTEDSIIVIQGEFPGTLKCVYSGESYSTIKSSIIKDADSLSTELISMQAQRYYNISESELQDRYIVRYIFTTKRGTKKGAVEFHKTTKTIVETMRFH
jgi:hypothetical protein